MSNQKPTGYHGHDYSCPAPAFECTCAVSVTEGVRLTGEQKPREWKIWNGCSTDLVRIDGPAIAYAENLTVVERSAYDALSAELAELRNAFAHRDGAITNTRIELASARQELEILRSRESQFESTIAETIKQRDQALDDHRVDMLEFSTLTDELTATSEKLAKVVESLEIIEDGSECEHRSCGCEVIAERALAELAGEES